MCKAAGPAVAVATTVLLLLRLLLMLLLLLLLLLQYVCYCYCAATAHAVAVATDVAVAAARRGQFMAFRSFLYAYPGLPLPFLCSSPYALAWALTALHMHAQRVCTVEAEAFVTSSRFKNRPGPGPCGDTVLLLRQETCGSRSKSGKKVQ